MNIQNNVKIYKEFESIKKNLSNLNLDEYDDIIDMLISLCDSYNTLSVSEIEKTEDNIKKLISKITNDKELPIQFKENFLTELKRTEKLLTDLTFTNIIESVQL